MKRCCLILLTCSTLLACHKDKKETATENDVATHGVVSAKEQVPLEIVPFKILTQDKLPQKVDMDADFSECSIAELVLLRNYVYAIHGCYFMEAEIERYFERNTDWYYPMVEKMAYEKEIVLDYKTTKLSQKEQEYVAAIDQRIRELMGQAEQENGLADPRALKTMWQFENVDTDFLKHLNAHNFAISETNYEQLFNVYEENEYRQVGSFVTTDLMLQLFHAYFVYAQKSLEKKVLADKMKRLCLIMNQQALACTQTDDLELLHSSVLPAASFVAAYFAVPYALLTDTLLDVPQSRELFSQEGNLLTTTPDYLSLVAQELANIKAQKQEISPLLGSKLYFPYDMFKPRGYYDKEEWSQRYFLAMQWLQLAGMEYTSQKNLEAITIMANILAASPEAMKLYTDINGIISFLTGEPDNISILNIAMKLQQQNEGKNTPEALPGAVKLTQDFIAKESKTKNRIRSKVANSADSAVNFMPARYTPDGQVLSQMMDEKPNSNRPFPRGLDVMCAFGSKTAEGLLTDFHRDPEKWNGWSKEMQQQKKALATCREKEADRTVYNKWLATLVELQNADKSTCPPFMRTSAWALKDANTALASWAELKHDAILYAEQPMLAECGGGGELPDPYVKGYVEPNLPFWAAMEKLCHLTRDKLTATSAMTPDLDDHLTSIQQMVEQLHQLAKKEMKGEPLSEDNYWYIHCIGSTVEWLSLSLVSPDIYLSSWSEVKGTDRSIACVADVFTRNITDCDKCGILHVATGNANAIYVIVRIGDYYYLTRGAVLSYREFVEPLGSRLTDGEWQQRLEKNPSYGTPEWMTPIISGKQPKVDESIFYSSGC